jgi:CheY-like chemotaxis protein
MKRILIVDDEPHVLRVLKLALERAGYAVDQAGDGKEALDYLQRGEPDVLITDIDMPRMTGRELCAHIEKELPERLFQIFILTSRAEMEHREWSRAIPNVTFLEKPVSIRNLVARLDEQCAKDAASQG